MEEPQSCVVVVESSVLVVGVWSSPRWDLVVHTQGQDVCTPPSHPRSATAASTHQHAKHAEGDEVRVLVRHPLQAYGHVCQLGEGGGAQAGVGQVFLSGHKASCNIT